MAVPSLYSERRILRLLEGAWSRLEGTLDRLTTAQARLPGAVASFNPLYHLGTLTIFLLIVILVTGIYLTIFYQPGVERAYESLQGISATWFGSLMRTVHRYASDALIVTMILHALKMLFSDRFWGARWLAWVSGMALLVLLLVIGVMGYFLIWDQQAQWAGVYFTDFLWGQVRLTFSSPAYTADSFGFFIIILFLHIFLSLVIIFGIWIHEMRLQRARLWSPRWLMIATSVILIALAVIWPVVSGPPADLNRLVTDVRLDWAYLGFLPLSGQFGSVPVWIASALIFGAVTALPWLWRGRHQGPALVTEENCTACALCARECPYDAIKMIPRQVDDRYETTAIVNPALCVGCGLCVGDCAPPGIELTGLPTQQVVTRLRESLIAAKSGGAAPLVVFACQRHVSLGTIPALASTSVGEPVMVGAWGGGNPHPEASVVTCALPCVGMAQSRWIKGSLNEGAQAVILLGCPGDDCNFREGPRWLEARMNRGVNQKLLGQQVFRLELAPGDRGEFTHLLGQMVSGGGKQPPAQRLAPRPVSLVAGAAFLLVTLALGLLADWPAQAADANQGAIRISLRHTAEVSLASLDLPPEVLETLPEDFNAEERVGGERFPVQLRVEIDGQQAGEWTYQPRGVRRDGASIGVEEITLAPGAHTVVIRLMDDGETWREVYSGEITVSAGEVSILRFDEETETFVLE